MLAFDVASHCFVALQRLALPACASQRCPGWQVVVDALARCVVVSSLDGAFAASAVVSPRRDLAQPLAGFVADGGLALQRPCWSLCFCDSSAGSPPTLMALLPTDECDAAGDGPQVAVLTVGGESHVRLHNILCCGLAGMTALEVLPVPGAPGLAILLCVGSVALVRLGESASVAFAVDTDAVPAAWLWLPRTDEGGMPALLLAADVGTLTLVQVDDKAMALYATAISAPNENAHAWPCISALAWLPDGCLLVSSHDGDGNVLRLPDVTSHRLAEPLVPTVVCTVPSTAPAVDVVAHGGALVLASGTKWSGTLRELHTGLEVRQLLISPPNFAATGVWPISTAAGAVHDVLIVSFVDATRALALCTSDWLDVSDALGLDVQTPTLAAGMLEDGVLVQVCAHGVRAVALQRTAAHGLRGSLLHDWSLSALHAVSALQPAATPPAPDAVSVAAVGHGVVLLGVAHAKALVLLRLLRQPGGVHLAPVRVVPLVSEVSCMCIARSGAAQLCAPGTAPDAGVAVVGSYSPLVTLYTLAAGAELETIACWAPGADTELLSHGVAAPRDLLPHSVHVAALAGGAGACVLVGTRGGALLRLERSAPMRALCCANVRLLGRLPLGLAPLGADPLSGDVLALSDRPWLVRLVSGTQRVDVQPLAPPADGVALCAALLTPPGSPPCILLVNGSRLRLVTLPGAPHHRVASTATPLWCAPRRLFPHGSSKALLVGYALAPAETSGTLRHELIAMHLASGMAVSSVARLRTGESVHALSVWYSPETDDTLVLVGTSLALQPGAPPEECPLGRLLVMRLDVHPAADSLGDADDDGEPAGPHLTGSSKWFVVGEAHLPGAVLSVAGGPSGFIAASAGATVYALHLMPGPGVPAALSSLERIASVRLRDVVTGLAWDGVTLAACDARDGAHLLLLSPEQRSLDFICSERARRPACALTSSGDCAAGIDRDGFFFSFSTAVTLAEGEEAESAGDAGGLIVNAQYGVGTALSAICSSGGTLGAPSFVVSTMLGGVVAFKPLAADTFALLAEAEACVAAHPLTAPLLGGDHAAMRGGPPLRRRVLDGDLLSQLLHLPERLQREVLSQSPSCAMGDDAGVQRILELMCAALG